MTERKHVKVLFVGIGVSRVAWYRVALPAMYLGGDWCGVIGEPPNLMFVTGAVGWETKIPNFMEYDVVVIQQPRGKHWFKFMNELRAAGKVVLVEYDDYVDGIRKATDHDFVDAFQPKALKDMKLCRQASDGMIASTDYIARRYKSTVKNTWVCENGLDMGRYRLTRPPRGYIGNTESVTIMWSGATGHVRGVSPWLTAVWEIMESYPETCFASIGQPFGQDMMARFQHRMIQVPFAQLETYPAAMMLGDIALAPAGQSAWYKGKSTLRAMEAAALGIPVVADTHYEDAVVHGQTGYMCDSPGDVAGALAYLVENRDVRHRMGDAARRYADEHFDMRHRIHQWKVAIAEAWSQKHGIDYTLAA